MYVEDMLPVEIGKENGGGKEREWLSLTASTLLHPQTASSVSTLEQSRACDRRYCNQSNHVCSVKCILRSNICTQNQGPCLTVRVLELERSRQALGFLPDG
jgi:hypothetical protein